MMDTWQGWLIGAVITIGVMAFARFARKNKLAVKAGNFGENLGKAFSLLLMRWLPPKVAEKAEEGIIVTLLACISTFLTGFESGILADNKSRNIKGGTDAGSSDNGTV
jgi:hypothetical protein